jgi:hypothetical protein
MAFSRLDSLGNPLRVFMGDETIPDERLDIRHTVKAAKKGEYGLVAGSFFKAGSEGFKNEAVVNAPDVEKGHQIFKAFAKLFLPGSAKPTAVSEADLGEAFAPKIAHLRSAELWE